MIKVLISMLPGLFKLLWAAYRQYKNGKDTKAIKRAISRVEEAFKDPDRAAGNRALNDIWNNSDSE